MPQVRRQLIAVIDDRTTLICLTAAGQIVPLEEPFDTVVGPQDMPPFHIHCRSIVQPWMPGFVNDVRADANSELMRRPLKQRDWRVVRHPPHSWEQKRALLLPRISGGMDDLPDPTIQRWVDRLADGSSLDDVPAELRHDLIIKSSRFTVETNQASGIRKSFWVTDETDGTRWLMKNEDLEGVQAEILYARLFTGMSDDLPVPKVMFAGRAEGLGSADGGGWVLVRHIDDEAGDAWTDLQRSGVDLGWPTPGGSVSVQVRRWPPPRLGSAASRADEFSVDDGDNVRILVSDWVTGDPDRHGANVMWLAHDDVAHLVPVDHGLGYSGISRRLRPIADAADSASRDRRLALKAEMTLDDWLQTPRPEAFANRLRVLADVDDVQRPLGRVIDAYDEVAAHLRSVDLDGLEAELQTVAVALRSDDLRHRTTWVMATLRHRIDELPDTDEFLRMFGLRNLDEVQDVMDRYHLTGAEARRLRRDMAAEHLLTDGPSYRERDEMVQQYLERRFLADTGQELAADELADFRRHMDQWGREMGFKSTEKIAVRDALSRLASGRRPRTSLERLLSYQADLGRAALRLRFGPRAPLIRIVHSEYGDAIRAAIARGDDLTVPMYPFNSWAIEEAQDYLESARWLQGGVTLRSSIDVDDTWGFGMAGHLPMLVGEVIVDNRVGLHTAAATIIGENTAGVDNIALYMQEARRLTRDTDEQLAVARIADKALSHLYPNTTRVVGVRYTAERPDVGELLEAVRRLGWSAEDVDEVMSLEALIRLVDAADPPFNSPQYVLRDQAAARWKAMTGLDWERA